ncbi:MAG: acetylglutamate kinase [Bacteroidaceae bacterium]|nr:acetylglutamate kinase [Bacteroidaceae bacterium]MCF0199278.1 acetylglutamate kinase [Bacteroidaceae bacterium]
MASPLLWQLARENRKRPTEAEGVMWKYLREHFCEVKFRRQQVVGNYIADFLCFDRRLVIEIDGGYHANEEQINNDQERTAYLMSQGLTVLRFTNEQVLGDIHTVLNEIKNQIEKSKMEENSNQSASPSPVGEGRGGVSVIKVGGAVVEQPAFLEDMLRRFAALPGLKVLVHGGGRSATQMASRLGIESKMVDGRRVTDDDTLQVVTMVYGGLVNKQLVARLQALGVNALGVTGADMNLIRAHKRPLKNGVDYGWVGDVDSADGPCLAHLLQSGVTPVVAPLTHDGEGHMLNTNADTIAQTVACALAPYFDVTLTYTFEKMGVLLDPDDDDSVIPHITPARYEELKEQGAISGGMIPKLDNAFEALNQGVARVIICSATCLDGANGTVIEK